MSADQAHQRGYQSKQVTVMCSQSRTKLWTLKFKETSTHRWGPANYCNTNFRLSGREHEVKGRTSSIAIMGVEDAQEGTSSSTISEDVHGLRKGGHVCPVWTKLQHYTVLRSLPWAVKETKASRVAFNSKPLSSNDSNDREPAQTFSPHVALAEVRRSSASVLALQRG